MEMKKLTNLVLILLGFSLLIITANAQMDCATGMLPSLLPCQGFLTNFFAVLPSQQCCTAVQNISVKASPANLCQCLELGLPGSGILPFKLDLIPNLCSLSNMAPIVGCILGTTTTSPPPPPPSITSSVPLLPPPSIASPVIPKEHQAPPPNI